MKLLLLLWLCNLLFTHFLEIDAGAAKPSKCAPTKCQSQAAPSCPKGKEVLGYTYGTCPDNQVVLQCCEPSLTANDAGDTAEEPSEDVLRAEDATVGPLIKEMNDRSLKPYVMTPEDKAFMNLTMAEREKVTKTAIVTMVEAPNKGRVVGVGDIGSVVEGAVSVGGMISKVGDTAVGLLSGLVNAAKLGVQIALEIERFIEKMEERAGFLKAILYEVLWQTQELCNVIVFNLNKKHEMKLKGIIYYARYHFRKAWFGVWVCEGGSFKNKALLKGDKWGFAGSYDVSGLLKDTVTFNHRPCYKSPPNQTEIYINPEAGN